MPDSLLSQTTRDFNVLVHDDGSRDGSLEILEKYKLKFDGRLSVITGAPSGSATSNFAILTRETKSDYMLFADQDEFSVDFLLRTNLLDKIRNARYVLPGGISVPLGGR